ncbi:MAG: DUF3298 and DUF4163 domain-containing protein [Algicola sp.]|nr:DUF3298 and DUF4163 domain-containing protein [Mangrovimonas yunxiaonensis]MBR9757579.1 DUF3298 and DUF4163 domain-containing protein [Algicola sp.]
MPITFKETVFNSKTTADIDILYPKVTEAHPIAKQINTEIEHYISQRLLFKDTTAQISIKAAAAAFDNELNQFKTAFPETPQHWEALIEGEVLYQTPALICIGISSYTYTGGAHGNDTIAFLNFNPETGALFTKAELFQNLSEFSALTESFLKKEIEIGKRETMADYFFGEAFKLPESIGFNEEGVIMLYNKYEIASYAQGITEFVIPYSEAEPFLKIMP